MCDPNAPKDDFTSDNPDKSQACYPCMCPDCPGFHECGYLYEEMKHGDTYECDICGEIVKFMPFTEEFIEKQISHSNDEKLRDLMHKDLTASMESGLDGYYETIRPCTDKVTS